MEHGNSAIICDTINTIQICSLLFFSHRAPVNVSAIHCRQSATSVHSVQNQISSRDGSGYWARPWNTHLRTLHCACFQNDISSWWKVRFRSDQWACESPWTATRKLGKQCVPPYKHQTVPLLLPFWGAPTDNCSASSDSVSSSLPLRDKALLILRISGETTALG